MSFGGIDDLVDKVRYYLSRDDKRMATAKAGYDRTIDEHTYAHRFKEIFHRMGFRRASDVSPTPGKTTEVT